MPSCFCSQPVPATHRGRKVGREGATIALREDSWVVQLHAGEGVGSTVLGGRAAMPD